MPVDVSSLRIVQYPAPVLRAKSKPIPLPPSAEVRAVAARMIELMFQAEGIGLAAPQVGLSWRLFVCHVPPAPPEPDGRDPGRSGEAVPPSATLEPRVYINPVLSGHSGAPEPLEEGCLSLPEIRGQVLRPPVVTVSAYDLDGRPFTQTAAGLLARCWQHEMDHLDGVLILDRMSQMSRLKNRAAVRDLERSAR